MDLHTFYNYSGFIGVVIGILLGLYLCKKYLETKAPCCYYKTYQEVLNSFPEGNPKIKVFYNAESVDRVFTTYLWFWNSGKKPVNKSDLLLRSKLKLKFLDTNYPLRILDYRVVKATRDVINFDVLRDTDSSLVIQFDFIDYNDGALIEIQHTGSKASEVKVEGVISGVPKGVYVINRQIQRFKWDNLRVSSSEQEKRPRQLRSLSQPGKLLITILYLASIVILIYRSSHINASRPTVTITKEEFREWLLTQNPDMTEETIRLLVDGTFGNSNPRYSILTALLLMISMGGVSIILVMIWLLASSVPKSLDFYGLPNQE